MSFEITFTPYAEIPPSDLELTGLIYVTPYWCDDRFFFVSTDNRCWQFSHSQDIPTTTWDLVSNGTEVAYSIFLNAIATYGVQGIKKAGLSTLSAGI